MQKKKCKKLYFTGNFPENLNCTENKLCKKKKIIKIQKYKNVEFKK